MNIFAAVSTALWLLFAVAAWDRRHELGHSKAVPIILFALGAWGLAVLLW